MQSSVLRAAPGGDWIPGQAQVWVVTIDGTLELHAGDGYGNFETAAYRYGKGWDSMRVLAGGFDFTGDGITDLYAVSSTGNLYLYPVGKNPSNGWPVIPGRQLIGSGWNSMQAVFSPGDFNGDHKADLMAVDGAGILWMYPGNGRGGFGTRVQVGSGWGGFGAVFPLRNFSGNGHMDVGAVDVAGNLYRYAGTGNGRFLPGRTLIGTHWNMYF